jgi:hypothetical protein
MLLSHEAYGRQINEASVLYGYCKDNGLFTSGYCNGYVFGTIATYLKEKPEDKFCGFDLDTAPLGLITKNVTKYLENHPEEGSGSNIEIIVRVLHESYPCGN